MITISIKGFIKGTLCDLFIKGTLFYLFIKGTLWDLFIEDTLCALFWRTPIIISFNLWIMLKNVVTKSWSSKLHGAIQALITFKGLKLKVTLRFSKCSSIDIQIFIWNRAGIDSATVDSCRQSTFPQLSTSMLQKKTLWGKTICVRTVVK